MTELCNEKLERDRIGWLADGASHIIEVYEGDTLRSFAYLTVKPWEGGNFSYLNLVCGRYTSGGPYPWKGSELIVDKANELAKVAGKKVLRLEALNQALIDKVYKPMGFNDVPGKYLIVERTVQGGGGSGLNVQRRRTQRYGRGRKHRKLRKLTTRRC
jgi:hypothetical protein